MIQVTRRYAFSAAHRLHVAAYSEARNQEVFGKCNNPYGHGHNYELFVTAAGKVDAVTGLAVDRERLDDLVNRAVLSKVDQKDFNRDVRDFAGALVPTTENVNLRIFGWLEEAWGSVFPPDGPRLKKVRIGETARNIFEVSR